MRYFTCPVKSCLYNKRSELASRNFTFNHLAKHTYEDLQNVVKENSIIKNPYHENKWTLINCILDFYERGIIQ